MGSKNPPPKINKEFGWTPRTHTNAALASNLNHPFSTQLHRRRMVVRRLNNLMVAGLMFNWKQFLKQFKRSQKKMEWFEMGKLSWYKMKFNTNIKNIDKIWKMNLVKKTDKFHESTARRNVLPYFLPIWKKNLSTSKNQNLLLKLISKFKMCSHISVFKVNKRKMGCLR